ncbi:proline dehydrogenase 1, mitochondrial-like [Paramacrobiotus metropolitanus]|uniref:proline dehydrogenase 1, mitochondrial-like n=1 Tax=Paramacrobiotus metropolitanus TaxID=2943436 RepID=UPI00244589FD|nr:proline dehydrogenase 1, mitochondrial-like [Paramacrobiotus metropolitanus]
MSGRCGEMLRVYNKTSLGGVRCVSISAPAASRVEHTRSHADTANVKFDDPKLAYQSRTTWEVFRSWMVLSFCKHEFLVDSSDKLIKFGRKVLGPKLFNRVMKKTFYGQFVAGENVDEIRPLIARMRRFGASIILNYAVEDDEQGSQQKKSGIMVQHEPKEDAGDVNLRYFMKCVDDMAEVTNGEGFAAIKVTALAKPETLTAMSDAIRKSQMFINHLLDRDAALPVTALNIPMDEMKRKLVEKGHDLGNVAVQAWLKGLATRDDMVIDSLNWRDILDRKMSLDQMSLLPGNASGQFLSDEERENAHNLARRMDTIAEHAFRKKMRILVDAEQSYFQPAIARFSLELMRRYNKEKPTIYNTYQCYLRDAHVNMMSHLELSRQEGFLFGAKVVRGAYIVLERERAQSLGYPDPINPDFETTSRMYEKVVSAILEDMLQRPGKANIVIAGHNEHTVRWAIDKIRALNIPQKTKQLYFGQLLGMCDHLSFTLAHNGYNVVKCVPYGSVDEVLPYLIRRAHENRGFMEKTVKERRLLRRELYRRLREGALLYNPNDLDGVVPHRR